MSLLLFLFFLLLPFAQSDKSCTQLQNCADIQCKSGESNAWLIALLWFDLNQESFDSYWQRLVESILMLAENGIVWSEDSWMPHITFQYLCCYTQSQYATMLSAFKQIKWRPLNATFDRLVCNDDTHLGDNTTSFIVRLSNSSQLQWSQTVRQFEDAIVNAGLPLHKPRSKMEFFHSTDAVVSRSFPTESVLKQINKQIPQWTENNEPIVVSRLLFLPWPLEFITATN